MNGLEMKYFVLKPKGKSAYARASRMAMLSYADLIRRENRELSDDLYHWANVEAESADTPEKEGK